jgi:adenosylhomocysteine nucleosidase
MDTSPLGDPVGMISGINLVKIPADCDTYEKMARCVSSLGVKVKIGTIASGDQFINNSDKKREIRDKFSALACEMEGAAIGHAAYVNNVKFAVIRAISDGAGDDSHMDYPTFAKKAAAVSAEAVKLFVKGE